MLTYRPHRKHPWNQLYKEQVLDHNASSSLLTDNFQLGQHKRSNILYVQEVLVTWAKDFWTHSGRGYPAEFFAMEININMNENDAKEINATGFVVVGSRDGQTQVQLLPPLLISLLLLGLK